MFQPTVESSRKRRFRAGTAWLWVGMLGLGCLVPNELLAQTPRGRIMLPGGDEDDANALRGRNRNLQPGRGPAGTAGPYGDVPRKKKATKIGSPREPGAGGEADADQLPKGFSVPPEPPDWLTTTDEWIFDPFKGETEREKKQDFNRKNTRFKDIAQKGELTKEEDKQILAEMIEWQLSQFTRNENREKVAKLREALFRDIKNSGTVRSGKADARAFMMQTVVSKAPKLFSYHLAARLNGAILLADLSEVNEKEQEGRNPPVKFTKAYVPLIDLLKQVDDKNQKQPEAVRIWAVDGLMRIGAIPETRPTVRNEIVDALVEQLGASANEHEWLQWRLAESLGVLGVAYNTLRQPVVVQALAKVLVDLQRPWLVRAEAAQSLGRLPLGNDVDLGLIAREIAHLAEQMADAYQKKPDQATWKLAFLKLYLAFKPANDDDAKKDKGLLTQVTNKPPLASHKRAVQEAYDVVLPIVQGVVNPPQNIAQAVTQLKDWLSKNPPRATSIAKDQDPIIKTPPAGGATEAPAGAGNTTAG